MEKEKIIKKEVEPKTKAKEKPSMIEVIFIENSINEGKTGFLPLVLAKKLESLKKVKILKKKGK